MASGENEAIAVHPLGVLGIVFHLRSVKRSSNLSTSERKTHVTRVGRGNGVHCETTCLVSGGGEGSHLINLGGGLRHHQGRSLTDGTESAGGGEPFNTGGESRTGNNKRRELHVWYSEKRDRK